MAWDSAVVVSMLGPALASVLEIKPASLVTQPDLVFNMPRSSNNSKDTLTNRHMEWVASDKHELVVASFVFARFGSTISRRKWVR